MGGIFANDVCCHLIIAEPKGTLPLLCPFTPVCAVSGLQPSTVFFALGFCPPFPSRPTSMAAPSQAPLPGWPFKVEPFVPVS